MLSVWEVGLKRDSSWWMEPDLAVEGGLDLFTNSWEVGKTGVTTSRVLTHAVAPLSCIFIWRLSSEMTISMRQRLAELRQRQPGAKQQGPISPQRASGPKQ